MRAEMLVLFSTMTVLPPDVAGGSTMVLRSIITNV